MLLASIASQRRNIDYRMNLSCIDDNDSVARRERNTIISSRLPPLRRRDALLGVLFHENEKAGGCYLLKPKRMKATYYRQW